MANNNLEKLYQILDALEKAGKDIDDIVAAKDKEILEV